MFTALNVENIDALVGSEEDMAKQAQNEEDERAHVKRIRELEIEKLQAEIAQIKSSAVQGNIDATSAAIESAAGIKGNTELVATADSLLDSAGFEDLSGGLMTGEGDPNIVPGPMPGPMPGPVPVQEAGPMPGTVPGPGPMPGPADGLGLVPAPEQIPIDLQEGTG
jgi:hypothetical protein